MASKFSLQRVNTVICAILSERMKREIEEQGVVPGSQAGFRKGRGTMDNVYILDHLTRNELKKKGGGYFLDRLYVANIDEMLKKAQLRGTVVGREKVWSLAFADDLVIVAKSEKEMKENDGVQQEKQEEERTIE
ncbi:hypothetical protein GEV33_008671 [Tenebrio molitor]|uniref:Reverse transcriptase domain-containing protein n=1 Tax=Tenebrio molitor TaxID=7067 RepID=A0A8J6HGT4_TENMO|nr:hypothetical protein GEV33_008671 [Tenebrio molitor]